MNKQDLLKYKIKDVGIIDDDDGSFLILVYFETSEEATIFFEFIVKNHPGVAIKKPNGFYEFVFKFGDYEHVLVFTSKKTPETYPPLKLLLEKGAKTKTFLGAGIKLGGGNFMTLGKVLISLPQN